MIAAAKVPSRVGEPRGSHRGRCHDDAQCRDAAHPSERPNQVQNVGRPQRVQGLPRNSNVESAVIIRRGDTLWRISRRVYGHGVRYSTIYLANETQISDPDRIWPGKIFKVPEKTLEGEPAIMKAVGKQATTTSKQ